MRNSIDLIGSDSKAKATTIFSVELAVAPHVDTSAGAQVHVVPIPWNLPAVLAGPIVRRATDTEVYLWLCTSTPCQIEAFVFNTSPDRVVGAGFESTRPFGARLHVALIRVLPRAGAFERDTILSYSMRIMTTRDAFDGEVAFHTSELAYGSAGYPGFVLPKDTTTTNIVQGSCRKLHGPGDDAMKQVDQQLESTAPYPGLRPQQLLLTGDQIYADDVHPAALALGQTLGPLLLGFDEYLPVDGKLVAASKLPGGAGAGKRGSIVSAAGFTADATDCVNHAMAFAEYAILYLLGWSADVWRFASQNFSALTGKGALPDVKINAAAAQRAMANVPTYMICDDHEVTDDWFIDADFYNNAITSPTLRRVLLNAIGAYWLFQAWGNAPTRFARRGEPLSYHLMSAAPFDAGATQLEGEFIEQHKWFFVTPAPANVIMLDTRTRRVLGTAPSPAGLLNDDALGELTAAVRSAPAGPIMMVSPPPVFGHVAFERLQKAQIKGYEEFYKYDFESWAANEHWFFKLLETIAATGRTQIVIFAGDVHYSCTVSVAYKIKSYPVVEVLHMTASSFKNKGLRGGAAGAEWSALTWAANALNTDSVLTAGILTSDRYVSYQGVFPKAYEANINVYINWHFHDLQSCRHLVLDNCIGVFSMERGTPNPQIRNLYPDERGLAHPGTDGTWRSLMHQVQGAARPSVF